MEAAAESARPVRRGPDRLIAEMQACWAILAEATGRVAEAAAAVRGVARPSGTLAGVRSHFEEETRVLLVEPIDHFLRLRPVRRSLEAMQECDQETDRGKLRSRARIDAGFQRLLAEASIDLCEPWRIRRSGDQADEWKDWELRRTAQAKRAAELLAKYEKWAQGSAQPGAGPGEDQRRAARFELWWRQNRAITSLLEIEVALRTLSLRWLDVTAELISGLHQERTEITGLTARMAQWVRDGANENEPVDVLEVASPEERMRSWSHRIEAACEQLLPERTELVEPGWRTTWRQFPAREAFLSAFGTFAKAPLSSIVTEAWGRSAGTLREVARAKEIIDYWREATPASAVDGQALMAEARNNASAMLAEQLEAASDPDSIEEKAATAFWWWVSHGSTVIEARQQGWVSLLRRPRGRRLFRVALESGQEGGRKRLHRAGRWGADEWEKLLESVGGKMPQRSSVEPVIRRSTLLDILALPAAKAQLPAIYQLLFRIAPVEDRRFLIGRDRELEGLNQALRDWDSGRFAACLLVGARGSGKTSLLNCATGEAFRGREPVRGQFHDRVLTREQIDGFLRELLGLDGDADIVEAFAAERRILMIEECERTFLRGVGGFQGVKYLMQLIHRTAATTLWVLVLNDKAFRVLEAGAGFGRVFSHRINAMNVSRQDLENAILERHRLSGLRLEFAPPPALDPRVSRIKQWMGLEDSPQKLFFDSLYQQSAGVFRSAFELWLASIDRVEGETLKVRQPLEPAFARFRNELLRDDHFTLMAIQEHGSVTQCEVAEILCENEEASGSRLDRMLALGLIERDPEHPGLRVKPEATRFVNDVLRRVNLA